MKKFLISLFIIWVPIFATASTLKDTIPPEDESATDKNLDSLVNTWYMQGSAGVDSFNIAEDDSVSLVVDFPDSVYINRLKKIPSVVELTYNEIVKRFIQVYTVKKRDKVEEMLGLKEHYFPIFEEILDSYGLPTELKYLSVIESALNPRAVSRAGATGLWQFMYGTGRLYKLQINSFVDERRDPIAATYAAAKFLKDLYGIYNDWILVIAAYNCGPGNVNKAIRRSGGKTNYWDIYYYLPRETRGYVPAYIAATYTLNYHKEHNLSVKSFNVPPLADTIMVTQNIHLQQISEVLNLPLQELRDLNPQYRRDVVPGAYTPSSLRLPTQFATQYIDNQAAIYQHRRNELFSGDFKTITPANFRSTSYRPAPPSGNMQKIYHTIKTGEVLGQIAEKYSVSASDLRYWNNIYGNKIIAGKQLVVYVPKKSTSTKLAQNNAKSVNNADNSEYITYKVKEGDTLWKIASQYEGVTYEDLRAWNNLSKNSTIVAGQTIRIKKLN
jgi:membrane-bound lytic murein transglycosylase D